MFRCLSSNLLKSNVKLCTFSSANLLHTSHIHYKKKKSKSDCGPKPKSFAVILCGCGALDGSEISEAVSIAIHLSSKNIVPRFYAPDIDICGTVNHLTKDPDTCGPPRNALVEAARLARASIKPLTDCHCCEHSGLLIPGGFGAARTLSDFASKGKDCGVHPKLRELIKEFDCASKPIGTMCIASAILARTLEGVKVTLGRKSPKEKWIYSDAIEKVQQMGAKVDMQDVTGVTFCKIYRAYSTPAWMDSQATYAEVHEGIGNMITMMSKCLK